MDALFDADSFVAFADYVAAFVAGGFGVTLAFWLVGHSAARLLNSIGEV